MQPSPPLSQLMKRRRRRCGGVFRTVEGSSSDFAVEYDWPYRSSTKTHAPNISIDASKANEAFFRRSDIEISHFSSSSDSSSSVLEMKNGRRKYSFERDCDTVRVEEPAVRNLATNEDVSTRSPSVYSQESEANPLKYPKEVDLRPTKLSSAVNKPAKPVDWPPRSSSLTLPKLRSYVGSNFNSSGTGMSAPKPDLQSVNPEVKLTRSSSTTFQSLRHVSSKLGARTRSFTDIITGKVGELKIGDARPRRAAAGQRDVLKDGGGNHALGGSDEHGPTRPIDPALRRDHAEGDRVVRRFFSSGKQKGGRQRKVY